MGPERRGSKKSFCPRRAAAGESRYILVVSTGSAGNGERVLMIAHSWREKPSCFLSSESEDCFKLGSANGLALSPSEAVSSEYPKETASATDTTNRPNHSVDLRIVHLHAESQFWSSPRGVGDAWIVHWASLRRHTICFRTAPVRCGLCIS